MSLLAKKIEPFIRQVSRLGSCCHRIESELARGRLRVGEVQLVYSSSFLSACAAWEALLEECLFDAVCSKGTSVRRSSRHATFRSRGRLRDVLLHPDKEYISIQSVTSAVRLASLFIDNGLPFSKISEPNQTHIQQAVWIRNAIAHQSESALRIFRQKVPGVTSLQPNQRTPGSFLRQEFRTSPSQRRYELYFAALKSAATELEKAWE